ncbi:MAG: ferredoxin domain-containing protein [Candidatus Freyarchaeota archaeon]
MIHDFEKIKVDAMLNIVYQMAIAAKTAPKAKGEDSVEIAVVDNKDKDKVAKVMHEIGAITKDERWHRDAVNVEQADFILLLGIKRSDVLGANCGACGFPTCEKMLSARSKDTPFPGPFCAFKLIDLGIAAGSAAKTASILNLDNRIMFRVGVAAKQLNLINADYILGIPVSATEKNPFFDRTKELYEQHLDQS